MNRETSSEVDRGVVRQTRRTVLGAGETRSTEKARFQYGSTAGQQETPAPSPDNDGQKLDDTLLVLVRKLRSPAPADVDGSPAVSANEYNPNKRAVQIRRAIEHHRERVALQALIGDVFSETLKGKRLLSRR
jgi:hypothetical protein